MAGARTNGGKTEENNFHVVGIPSPAPPEAPSPAPDGAAAPRPPPSFFLCPRPPAPLPLPPEATVSATPALAPTEPSGADAGADCSGPPLLDAVNAAAAAAFFGGRPRLQRGERTVTPQTQLRTADYR